MSKLIQAPLVRLFFAAFLLPSCSVSLSAQTPPSIQGTSLADTAGPTFIAPAQFGSDFFVLNKDLSQLRRNASTTSYFVNCAAPSGFTAATSTQRTYLTDDSSTYTTAQSSSATGIAANGTNFGSSTCANGAPLALTGNAPAQSLASNDPRHGRYFVLSAFNGGSPDLLTVFNNLNTNSSSTPSLSQKNRTSLDTGAQYTSIVTDVASNYGLTAITELKTSTSPGHLWVYSPGINTAFKVLGPGGVALPAIGAFILPPLNDGGGSLLVLVNQDNLTSSNLSNPPQDTTPFTIIDLGQLQRSFSAVVASGNTITLPFVTQIKATSSFYAMLGAAYNPVNHLLYAIVGGGTSSSSVTESVLSYNPRSPTAPAETLVGDVSMVPFTFGVYPQVALNAASGTLQILTSSPAGLYSVGITGTGNTAVAIGGSPFADSNFTPTYLAANPLAGETYIASAAQIDILTKPSGTQNRATVEIDGPDTAIVNQNYSLYARTLYPAADSALINAVVTITATPASGAPFTFTTSTVGNFAGTYALASGTFPSVGVYTLVATVPATTNYPAITSLPISVTVGTTANPGVYPTTLSLTVPSSSSTTVNGSITLSGSTYAPTGRIVVTDATNTEVGRITLAGAPITIPMSVSLTLPQGTSVLKAIYNGDDQNAASTSPTITVGGASTTTPTLTQTTPATGTVGATLSGFITFASTTTVAPTDVISIYAIPAGTTTPITLTTVPASQAFISGGKAFTFTAPSAGTYTILAYYGGDSGYNTATSNTSQLVTSSPAKGTIALIASAASAQAASSAQTGTITATLSGANGNTPTGNIVLVALSTGTGSSQVLATVPASVAATNGSNTVTFAAPSTAGSYTFAASYAGDTNFAASTSASIAVTVSPVIVATSLSISTVSTVPAGTTFAPTVQLVPKSTSATPITGYVLVQLNDGSGKLVSSALVLASTAVQSGGSTSASLTVPASQTPGAYTLNASYQGDAAYGTSNASIGITVTAPSSPTFSLTLDNAPSYGGTLEVDLTSKGEQVYVPFTVTSLGGFNTVVSLDLYLDADDAVIRHSFVDVNNKDAFLLTTFVPSASGTHFKVNLQDAGFAHASNSSPMARNTNILCATLLAGGLCLLGLRRRRKSWTQSLLLLPLFLCVIGMAGTILPGCGVDKDEVHVTIKATPAGTAYEPKTVTFTVHYTH